MRVAVTGATGFLGRHIVRHLIEQGHQCRCWYRPSSDRDGFAEYGQGDLEWVAGTLNDPAATAELVDGVEAVVHAGLHRPGAGFRGAEGDLVEFVQANVVGSVRLMQAARDVGVGRFVFISSCSVHEVILDDRPLDETHPLWATSHYGAHKGAIEKFVHSFGFGDGWDICALRPTGIYGVSRSVEKSKWYDVVRKVKAGEPVERAYGGKEVHAADVARAVEILLAADGVAGQTYNCYDMTISTTMVGEIAKRLTGSESSIADIGRAAKYEIVTDKLRSLGMTFGGESLLEATVAELLSAM